MSFGTGVADRYGGSRRSDINEVMAVAPSPDGKNIASAGADFKIKIWSVATGTCLLTIDGPESRPQDLDFSPDGNTLVSTHHDGTLRFARHAVKQTVAITMDE